MLLVVRLIELGRDFRFPKIYKWQFCTVVWILKGLIKQVIGRNQQAIIDQFAGPSQDARV